LRIQLAQRIPCIKRYDASIGLPEEDRKDGQGYLISLSNIPEKISALGQPSFQQERVEPQRAILPLSPFSMIRFLLSNPDRSVISLLQ